VLAQCKKQISIINISKDIKKREFLKMGWGAIGVGSTGFRPFLKLIQYNKRKKTNWARYNI
jgi:hypothetical protein